MEHPFWVSGKQYKNQTGSKVFKLDPQNRLFDPKSIKIELSSKKVFVLLTWSNFYNIWTLSRGFWGPYIRPDYVQPHQGTLIYPPPHKHFMLYAPIYFPMTNYLWYWQIFYFITNLAFFESHFILQKLKKLHVHKLQINFEWLKHTNNAGTSLVIDFLHSFNGLSAGWASVSSGSQ